ncbi:MAG: two-component system NtrC family sensor kinase [Myxococcota bacterium]
MPGWVFFAPVGLNRPGRRHDALDVQQETTIPNPASATLSSAISPSGIVAAKPQEDVARLRELNQILEDKVVERTGLLMRAKRTWEATFDAIVDPLAIVDESFTIVRTNLAIATLSEVDVRTVPGRHCYEVLFDRDYPCAGCPARAALRTGETAEGEVNDPRRDRVFRVWSFPMRTDQTTDAGTRQVVCHYKDVTEEKDLQAKLLQSEKMAAVGTLAGGVAHEINNPLGAIMAFSQLALQDVEKGTVLHEFIEEIERSATRCKSIVRGLLDFSRPSRGERAPVSLSAVIDRALFLCSAHMRHTKVEVVTDCAEVQGQVIGDHNQIEQVLLNLLSNAYDAMGDAGGTITIRVWSTETGAHLSVADTGPGIEPRYRDNIFEPFFTTKPEGKGTGLGLSISYSILKDHRASVVVESEVGEGTEFVITFPLIRVALEDNNAS